MAYSTYLIKIKGITSSQTASSDYVVPLTALSFNSYKATRSTLDGSAKRNGKGRLKRKTYSHRVCHCKFTFRQMKADELYDIWKEMRARYVKVRQKKVKASIWVPEINDYVEDYFYMPDIEFTILRIEDNKPIYAATDVELIGY